MPQTPAQKRAKDKYDKKHYKTIGCKCKLSDYDKYTAYAEKCGIMSMSALINKAVKHCMDNDIML